MSSRAGIRRPWAMAAVVCLSASAAFLGSRPPAAGADAVGVTTLVSISSEGVQGDNPSYFPSLSGNGRYVAFDSTASNLVPGDTNARHDAFVRDRATGTTSRVSVSSSEAQSEGDPGEWEDGLETTPVISADGRYVAFATDAFNLVPGDTNFYTDVFVRDRQAGTTERVSISSSGRQGNGDSEGPVISGHGRYVAFSSTSTTLAPGGRDVGGVFVRDRTTKTLRRVSVNDHGVAGNGFSTGAAISAHGGTVAFQSAATNLVPGDHNKHTDVFLRKAPGVTRRVSVSSAEIGANGNSSSPTVSAHGRYVAFVSAATNLVAGDTNSLRDVFVRDLKTGTTQRISVASDGSESNGDNTDAVISGDGRYVAFTSTASNLAPGGGLPTAYIRDRWTGTTSLVSVGDTGEATDGLIGSISISRDGHHVAFASSATNLVPEDTNGYPDVFVRHTSP